MFLVGLTLKSITFTNLSFITSYLSHGSRSETLCLIYSKKGTSSLWDMTLGQRWWEWWCSVIVTRVLKPGICFQGNLCFLCQH